MWASLIPSGGILSRAEFFEELQKIDLPKVSQKKNKDTPGGTEYYNIPAAFDIEVTSFYKFNYVAPELKRGIMYHWQFGICNLVTTGRTWEEFWAFMMMLSAVLDISDERRLVIYVHNLSYEFSFIRKRFKWDKVFLLDNRKPVYARTSGLEFRDMLKLAGGRSLANVAKDLQKYKVQKMVGDLDYSLPRNSKTPLTEEELKYCENDIRVCLAYIQEKIEQDGSILQIPLTNTGYVRRRCRKACSRHWRRYRNFMNALTVEPYEYRMLKRGFMGGFTHANAAYVQKVLELVGSFDLTSAYPSKIVLEKFPMSKGFAVKCPMTFEEARPYLNRYCCLLTLVATGVTARLTYDYPISISKCIAYEGAVDVNGRLQTARYIVTTCTEIDLKTYLRFYNFGSFKIIEMICYEKDYLPVPLVKAILDLYVPKTKLKGVLGQEVEYMISKNMLNAGFGMMVTDPVRDEYDFEEDFLPPKKADVESAIEAYNTDIKRFLFYPWGVWVTAYTRATLFEAIEAMGNDYVYADTDSVKVLHPESHKEYFEQFNQNIVAKIHKVMELRQHEWELYSPEDAHGKERTIGFWDFEGIYDQFKTLGAKRYLVRTGTEYVLTVAGTNKVKSCDFLVKTGKPFERFDNNLVVPAGASGRTAVSYIDFETEGDLTDYLGNTAHYHELTSVHMEETEYSLSMTDAFINFLKGVVMVVE